MGNGTTPLINAPHIVIDGSLCKGDVTLVECNAIRCEAMQWTAILGASGIGKSTLLRVLAGLPTHWQFKGDIRASDGNPLSGRVAMMAQQDLLLPWADLIENVTLGARMRGERVDTEYVLEIIDRVGLADHMHKRPTQLSGGQRQRVALARTLMENRPLVLLDEPFSALDTRTRSQMQDLAAELLEGCTVLMVTHDPAEATRMGHRVLWLNSSGIEDIPLPDSKPPRAVDDAEALMMQGQLLRRLREES